MKLMHDAAASASSSYSSSSGGDGDGGGGGPVMLESWSHFPPPSLRVQQAILKVVRIARKYVGFRSKRALWVRLSRFVLRIQKCWRSYRARRARTLLAAVQPIQRMWRGHKARRVYRLLRKYHLSYAAANTAAVRIQSFIRMLLARKKVMVIAMVVQQKIEQIKGLIIFVQRMFRRRLQKRQQMTSKSMLETVLSFQARIRGIRLRRMLASVDPNAARQLKLLSSSVMLKRRRYAAVCLIQRVYRGFVARKLVRAKRAALEQEARRLRHAWTSFQTQDDIQRVFRGHESAKQLLAALEIFPPHVHAHTSAALDDIPSSTLSSAASATAPQPPRASSASSTSASAALPNST